MKFNEIGMPKGAHRNAKRRGKGSGSGHGKTSCRGRKGARKRSGRTTRPGFEGGQMPLLRRIPKRGFNSRFRNAYQVVNVESLNRFGANLTIGPAEMKEAGLIGSTVEPVKILGGGKIEKALTVKAHKVSVSAKKLLEDAGCHIVIASPDLSAEAKGGSALAKAEGPKQSKKENASAARLAAKPLASRPRNDGTK